MSHPTRPTWQQALKDAALKLAREAERYVGANDAAPCVNCEDPRSAHCGCGMHCFGTMDGRGGGKPCECQGFVAKAEG
jgi:hypothetical protein